MTFSVRARSLAALLLCAGLSLSGAGVRAQSAPPVFGNDADERGAYEDYRNNRLVTARAKAERVLARDEQSIVANFVMGAVLHEAEGLPSRGMHYLARARALYESRFGTTRQASGDLWKLHEEILYATQRLAGELEEHAFRLQILEFHDALYNPQLIAQRALTLMRMGRFVEARARAREAMASTDSDQRVLGQNALCAIETEAGERQSSFDACSAALTAARARPIPEGETSPRLAVYAYNAAEAAYAMVRHDDVERFALEATHHIEFTPANPWRILTRLYVDAGRTQDAITATQSMQRWRAAQPAYLRDQDRAESDTALATLLLVAGEPEIGLRFVTRAMDRPDRRGLVSSKPEQALGAHALLRRAMLRSAAEVSAEQASVTPGLALAQRAEAFGRMVRAWPDDERVVSVLAQDERLVATLRGYVGGGLAPLPSWMVGDLAEILGAGVFAVALGEARERDAAIPAMRPYHEGLAADLAFVRGENSECVRLVRRATAALPRWETMLTARLFALGAEAARRDGDLSASRALMEQALGKDPGVVRRMGLRIAAAVRAEGSDPVAVRAAELLGGSPRLRQDPGGFAVIVSREANHHRVCLRTPQGNTVRCVDMTPGPANETVDQGASRIGREFHREIFASRTGFAQIDLRSLDGTTTSGRDTTRESLRGMLQQTGDGTGPERTR
ncbi:MAG: hypothetical protein Q8Q09_02150 [Deltaproteobacteria bacterium]|nr:hypothetical protein [Deltaproteobacteria bacterium]